MNWLPMAYSYLSGIKSLKGLIKKEKTRLKKKASSLRSFKKPIK